MRVKRVSRGPISRAVASPQLLAALDDHYGLRGTDGIRDLGGSSTLNLLLTDGPQRVVARVYRPWVTSARLVAIQRVRQHLAASGVPCELPLPTRDGQPWIAVDDHLVEVEPYANHDAKMDTWDRLALGLPVLGRIHTLLRSHAVSAAARAALAANHIERRAMLSGVRRGVQKIRQWDASPAERDLATAAAELAQQVAAAERTLPTLPRQMVHGDFWDNNVLFQAGSVVYVGDLDFMGHRPRIDDLALTLYYTNSTFAADRASAQRAPLLRTLIDAYESGLDSPLTRDERAALPLALARTPLCFISMIPSLDSERGARQLVGEMTDDIAWALAIMRDLVHWQAAFA